MIGIETENGFQQCDGTSVPDTALDSTSTNSAQNKVLTQALADLITVVVATGSLTIAGNSQNIGDLQFTVPSGYKAITAIPRSASSWAWTWVQCMLTSQSTVSAVIKSLESNEATYPVSASVLCIKDFS